MQSKALFGVCMYAALLFMLCQRSVAGQDGAQCALTNNTSQKADKQVYTGDAIIEDADIAAAYNHLPPAIVNNEMRQAYVCYASQVAYYLKEKECLKSMLGNLCDRFAQYIDQEVFVAQLDAALIRMYDECYREFFGIIQQSHKQEFESVALYEAYIAQQGEVYLRRRGLVLAAFSVLYAAAEDESLAVTTWLRKKLRRNV